MRSSGWLLGAFLVLVGGIVLMLTGRDPDVLPGLFETGVRGVPVEALSGGDSSESSAGIVTEPFRGGREMPSGDEKAGVLVVRVIDGEGKEAVPGVRLFVPDLGRRLVRGPLPSLISDERGVVRIPGVTPGPLLVFGGPGGSARASVRVGAESSVDLVLPVGRLPGRVVGPDGRPVPDAEILLSISDRHGAPMEVVARSDASGAFQLQHVGEDREIAARKEGFAPSGSHAVDRALRSGRILTLRLGSEEASLAGTVVTRDGRGVAGARVTWVPSAGEITEDSGSGGQEASRPPSQATRTDGGGGFRFRALPAGRSCILVQAAGFSPVLESVDLAPGSRRSVRIEIGPGFTVRGTVNGGSGKPAAGALVLCRPYPLEWLPPILARTDAQGRYELQNLPPGERCLTAFERMEGRTTARFIGRDGETLQWDAVLELGRSIRGHIAVPDGTPHGAFLVNLVGKSLFEDEPPPVLGSAGVGRDGRFLIQNVPEGPRCLEVYERGKTSRPVARIEEPPLVPEEVSIELSSANLHSAYIAGSLPDLERTVEATLVVLPGGRDLGLRYPLKAKTGRFRIGPLIPGPHGLRILTSLEATLDLGNRMLKAGSTLDLGELPLPEPAWLTVAGAEEQGRIAGMRVRVEPLMLPEGFTARTRIIEQPGGTANVLLFPGRYALTARASGGRVGRLTVSLTAGEERAEIVHLTRQRPVLLRVEALPQEVAKGRLDILRGGEVVRERIVKRRPRSGRMQVLVHLPAGGYEARFTSSGFRARKSFDVVTENAEAGRTLRVVLEVEKAP